MTFQPEQKICLHFAHANGFPFGSYRTLVEALPSHFRISGKEKLGHDPHWPVSDNWSYIVQELLNYLQLHSESDERVFLVGHSFGAVVSYMAACLAPAKVAGLIMLDPPLVTGWRSHLVKVLKKTPLIDKITPAGLAKTRNTQWTGSMDMVEYFSNKALFAEMDRRCVEDYVHSATKREQNAIRLTFRHDIEAAIFRNVPDNLNTFAGKLQCPGLLVTGKDSTVCMPYMRDLFIKQNSLEHVIMSGGHMFPLEYPESTASLIEHTLFRWQNGTRKRD
ncbi:alpha/beta hydrolase [Alteromonas ponticola]|uniref:Alpha/beta hydrolase n=1 Tax=Alteromonas aquimaris TaxID=2998417 RepID=A0ABT3P7K9_9ALTE|nr:alpha/beta hydrolase [Alteromonas aquimaris]MCW8108753.1 alpha/beta hydrolase [Alteromonas aquimaris]